MTSTTVASNGELEFYGGIILDGTEPTAAQRTKIQAYLKKRTARAF